MPLNVRTRHCRCRQHPVAVPCSGRLPASDDSDFGSGSSSYHCRWQLAGTEIWCDRSHRLTPARLVVAVENVGAYYSLPILQVLAATTRAASLLVATPDSQLRSFTRVSVLPLL